LVKTIRARLKLVSIIRNHHCSSGPSPLRVFFGSAQARPTPMLPHSLAPRCYPPGPVVARSHPSAVRVYAARVPPPSTVMRQRRRPRPPARGRCRPPEPFPAAPGPSLSHPFHPPRVARLPRPPSTAFHRSPFKREPRPPPPPVPCFFFSAPTQPSQLPPASRPCPAAHRGHFPSRRRVPPLRRRLCSAPHVEPPLG
jgi:hypothetical protein